MRLFYKQTINYVHSATDKLSAKGYEFGPADIYPAYTPNPLLVVLTMIGSISLFVYVGQMFISMSQHKQLVLFLHYHYYPLLDLL